MCELIHLTTNGLLSAFSPLSGGNRDGSIDSQRKLLRCSVCAGETPCIFFLMNYQPFVFLHARSPPCPARGGLSGGGRMAPHVVPFTWPVLCSCSICWWCCCWYFVIIAQHFPSQLCTIFIFWSHIWSGVCVLFSPLRWQQGRDHQPQTWHFMMI